jgi:hypothetical protein
MRNSLIILLSLFTALLFSACKTSFRISVRTPPVIQLDNNVTKLLVINNITEENSPEKALTQVLQGQQRNGNLMAAEQTVIGIMRSLDESGVLKGVLGASQSLRNSDQTVNWKNVDSICAAMGVQGIIELERFESQAPIGGTVLANATGQTRSPLRGSAYTNIYLSTIHVHADQIDIHEVYNIPTSGNTNPLNLLNDVMRKREYYGHLGFSIGYRIGSLFYSRWVWVNRQYYNKGSRQLRMAKRLIRHGNWDIAEKQLESSIHSHKNKVAGRSKYNMALIYEGQGRIHEAIEMAEKAAFENGTKLAYRYINTLKRRLALQPTLFLVQD